MTSTRKIFRTHFLHATIACVAGILATALFSCKVGPNYHRPSMQVPTTFKSEIGTATQPTTTPSTMPHLTANWWLLFNDPNLTLLETTAIDHNQNIQAAIAKVLEARAAARIAKSAFYPTITAVPSFVRSRSSANAVRRSTSSNSNGFTNSSFNSRTTSQYQIPFDLSYEVDVWGRVRRTVEASNALLQASADDFQVVLQTMQADLAQDYFNLRSLDAQDKILLASVQSYREQVALIRRQQKVGLLGGVDVAQAESLLDATITQEIDTRRQRADMEHAVAVLTGVPPAMLSIGTNPLAAEPPIIPAGLPMELLRRRPDVAEAEQNLIAASADVGVATANFYPVFTIAGSAGLESFDLQHLLDWQSRFWELGPNVTIPIFEGGKLTASLEQAKQQYNQFRAAYRQQILTAFQDVEDSLTDLHLRADESATQDAAVKASAEYVRLSQKQYTSGLIPYLTVIDANRTLLQNQLSQAQILNQRLTSTIFLIKSLGGGWDANSSAATQP